MKRTYSTMKLIISMTVAFLYSNNCLSANEVLDSLIAKQKNEQLVSRLEALKSRSTMFSPAYDPIYKAVLSWYALWNDKHETEVDSWMVDPDIYVAELADALEQGHNFIAENPGASFPLAFEKRLPDGTEFACNYLLSIPKDFPKEGNKFPLIISLHGSGWLGHKISFIRGKGEGGRVFQVTPINEGGPWKLDFLNTYLDELLKILPIDPERIYVKGHSLGAMGTWQWALNNPERFAAISPRSGIGEPFRAIRLKNVPAWVIHGEKDNSVLSGFSDQMVSAMQDCGGSVKYSLLKDMEHNLPAGFDESQITDWFLRQTRSDEPVPIDPVDTLQISTSANPQWRIIDIPEQLYWKSDEVAFPEANPMNRSLFGSIKLLFEKAHDAGLLVDSPVIQKLNTTNNTMSLWLAVPKTLTPNPVLDSSVIKMEHRTALRFYFRGNLRQALEHIKDASKEAHAKGYSISDIIWINHLSGRGRSSGTLDEYIIELN